MKRLSVLISLLKAFEEFALFVRVKWRATLLAIFFVSLMTILSLFSYYIFQKVSVINEGINKIEPAPSPDELQEGLINYVSNNLSIENQLGLIRKGEKEQRLR